MFKHTENSSFPLNRKDARPRTSHQARRLAKLSNEEFVVDGKCVYLLDTYSYKDRSIAIVSYIDDSGIFEIFSDQLKRI